MNHLIEKKRQTGLLGNIRNGIKESGVKRYLILAQILSLGTGIITYIQNLIWFWIVEALTDQDVEKVRKLLVFNMIMSILRQRAELKIQSVLSDHVYVQFEINQLTLYKKMFFNCAKSQLEQTNWSELITSIDKGVNAQGNILANSLDIVKPPMLILACMTSIISRTGGIGIVLLFMIFLLMATGIYFKSLDYIELSEIQELTRPTSSYLSVLNQSLDSRILNGMKEKTLDEMNHHKTYEKKLNQKQWAGRRGHYQILRNMSVILKTIFINVFISSLKNKLDVIPIYNYLGDVVGHVWWLFHSLSYMIKESSKYAGLEEALKNLEMRDNTPKEKFRVVSVLSQWFPEFKEDTWTIEITGKSGSGKTTWIRKFLGDLYDKYDPKWIYISQNENVPKSKMITIWKYMTFLVERPGKLTRCKLLALADWLNLEKVINSDTLNKSFVKPSGGECKRINIIQALLPIVLGEEINLILLDEVSSGLDPATWKLVQDLLQWIQKTNKVYIINIDHHKESKANLTYSVSFPKTKNDIKTNQSISIDCHMRNFKEKKVIEVVIDDRVNPKDEVQRDWWSWIVFKFSGGKSPKKKKKPTNFPRPLLTHIP